MKVGSLVTPRWNKSKMVQEIAKLSIIIAMRIQDLPEIGQIYTVSETYTCPCCNKHYCWVIEMPKVFMSPYSSKGLPDYFYVEVQEGMDAQSIVNKILEETPLVVGVNPCAIH